MPMLGAGAMAFAKGEATSRVPTPAPPASSAPSTAPVDWEKHHAGGGSAAHSRASSRRSSKASIAEALEAAGAPSTRSRPSTPMSSASITRLSRPRTAPALTALASTDTMAAASVPAVRPASGKGSLTYSASMQTLHDKRRRLQNSASLQSLNSLHSTPQWGFGASSRDCANKLFVSQQHTISLQYGWGSPGPTKYKLAASVGGKQPDGRKPDPPVWGMGKPGSRFLYGYATPKEKEDARRIGPATYKKHPAIGGTQPDGARANPPSWRVGSATRDQHRRVYITKEITMALLAGTESPGPNLYSPVCRIGGKQPDGAHLDPPVWTMRTRDRHPIEPGGSEEGGFGVTPKLRSPGVGSYDLKRGIGKPQAVGDPIRSEPAFSIAADNRLPVEAGLDSPGCIYNLPSAVGAQVADCGGVHGVRPNGAKPSAPKACMAAFDRWHNINAELKRNSVPGPGHYG